MTLLLRLSTVVMLSAFGCQQQASAPSSAPATPAAQPIIRGSNTPPLDANNIVNIASNSKEHTTLVAAIKAADYVTSVAASGPLTVFAPTDAAFAKLPEGTVESLVKPENVDKLRQILQYHVTTSALETQYFKDGQKLSMANGKKATLAIDGNKVSINGANVVASVRGSNGMVHVIDAVLLPPES